MSNERVQIANWPDGGSKEAVALQLTRLAINGSNAPDRYGEKNLFRVYANALRVVNGDDPKDLT